MERKAAENLSAQISAHLRSSHPVVRANAPAGRTAGMEQREQEDVSSVAADDLTAGISLGSTGGAPVGEEPDEVGGVDAVVEGGRDLAWGRDARELERLDDEQED